MSSKQNSNRSHGLFNLSKIQQMLSAEEAKRIKWLLVSFALPVACILKLYHRCCRRNWDAFYEEVKHSAPCLLTKIDFKKGFFEKVVWKLIYANSQLWISSWKICWETIKPISIINYRLEIWIASPVLPSYGMVFRSFCSPLTLQCWNICLLWKFSSTLWLWK